MNVKFTNHALQRYKERFGQQSIKILRERFNKSEHVKTKRDGSWERRYGRIVFVGCNKDGRYNVVTVKYFKE